jgi:hypothetical protein
MIAKASNIREEVQTGVNEALLPRTQIGRLRSLLASNISGKDRVESPISEEEQLRGW